MSELAKPREGSPCNGCGLCCRLEVCGIGKRVYGLHTGPCQALRWNGQRYVCSLVELEASAGLNPVFAQSLGIGQGCDSSDDVE